MHKLIFNDSFDFDAPVAAVVHLCKSGIDRSWMQKRASAVFDFERLVARPNETLLHMLAVGDGEVTGANRNGDFFPKAANAQYYSTFLRAHYFHNHDNKDPAKAYGRVVAAAHNDRMGRIELIVGLDNDKCRDDLEELEKKGQFPVSMSCLVPFDECSICGNKAKSRAEYCKHASDMMGRILDDGRHVHVINRHPNYFDISKVLRGADRVALALGRVHPRQKAASAARIIGGAELAERYGASPISLVRAADTRARAAFEKLAAAAQRWGSKLSINVFGDEDPQVLEKLARDATAAIEATAREGVCLSLEGFLQVTGMNKGGAVSVPAVRSSLQQLFLAGDPVRAENVCQNATYRVAPTLSNSMLDAARALKAAGCVDPVYANHRVLRKVAADGAVPRPQVKAAQVADVQADVLADEYAAYLVTFVQRMQSTPSAEFATNLTAFRAFA